jgi:hypothetical protein
MSDLFTEAVRDAQKLREIAESDAKNAIVEKLAPYIKEMIAKEVSGQSDFYFEQDENPIPEEEEEQLAAPQPPADPQGLQGPTPTAEPAATTDAMQPDDLGAGLGDQPEQAPLTPEGEEVMNATMPDEEGKITIDFEDLFVDDGSVTIDQSELGKLAPVQAIGAPPAPAGDLAPELETPAEPAPVAPEVAGEEEPVEELELPVESVTYPEFQRVFSNIAERIDRVFFSESVSDINRETLKQRLFDLLETIDVMKNGGLITTKQARLQENKLEFLFLKLKEAGLHNSYNMNNSDKDTNMKSLKEFAAKLFEEDENLAKDSQSSGESGMPVDDEYSEHAADVSGVDPKLGSRKDVGVAAKDETPLAEDSVADADPISGDVEGEHGWEEGEPVVDEEDQDETVTRDMSEASARPGDQELPDEDVAEGHAGFGDTDEEPETAGLAAESVSYEVDPDELAEAVRDIRRESIKEKMSKLKEASDGAEAESWEDGEPEGGEDGSLENLEDKNHDNKKLKEGTMEEENLGEMDMPVEMDMDSGEEDDLGDGGEADLVLSVDLPPEVEEELADLGLGDEDVSVDVELNLGGLGDEDEVEVVDDEGPEGPGSEEEDMVLADEAVSPSEMAYEAKFRHSVRKNKLLEKKVGKAAKLLEEKNSELQNLKKQLVETNLFTAKAVCYSRFLQRALTEKSLGKKALQQIVEHLDKGRTVAETKAIYGAIKRKLDEHATASRKLDGSSSKVTKPGSANLNEGADPQASQQDPNGQTAARWQMLAGIPKQSS